MDTLESKRREDLEKNKLEGYANFKIGGDLPSKQMDRFIWPKLRANQIFDYLLKYWVNVEQYEEEVKIIQDSRSEQNDKKILTHEEIRVDKLEKISFEKYIVTKPRLLASKLKVPRDYVYSINREIIRLLKLNNRLQIDNKKIRSARKQILISTIKGLITCNTHQFYTSADVKR